MNILSIQLGHNATAGLLVNGKIESIVSQEKFDYVKNSTEFPDASIRWLLGRSGLSGPQIDCVAVSHLSVVPSQMDLIQVKKPIFSGLWAEIDYRFPAITEFIRGTMLNGMREARNKRQRENLTEKLEKMYSIRRSKVFFIEHHKCHAYTPFYGFIPKIDNDKWLIMTADGSGDYYSSTVNKAYNNKVERIAQTLNKYSLGYVYSLATQYLGMKPLEHEYKVMGLAAYVKEGYAKKVYEKFFRPLVYLNKDGLTFGSKFPTPRFEMYLKENMGGQRFDSIAWSVQKLTEDLITNWVKNAVEKTNVLNLATSGGVFMNVKANMLLADMKELKNVFFTPSAGDESNPIGAAYYAYLHHMEGDPKKIIPVKDLYLGPEFSNEDIESVLKAKDATRKYRVDYYKDMEGTIAELISRGGIVARFAGKCEWGARALGNRSILGDPSKMETFYTVNDQIKQRDFWMPFAPTMLAERANDYIMNPNKRDAPYMAVAFRSTDEGKKCFTAAMHHGDWTLRPQILEKDWNPKYYKIIKEFEKETGIGGVLNTSFNLHGYPIACSPEQAMHVFENSDLQYLAMENYLVQKR